MSASLVAGMKRLNPSPRFECVQYNESKSLKVSHVRPVSGTKMIKCKTAAGMQLEY